MDKTTIQLLLVDDEIPFLRTMKNFNWGKYGYECVGTASNGKDAYEKCTKLKPHVIITDVHMPTMDGIALMQVLKRDFPNTIIILLTVHKSFDFAQEALRYGAISYIVKSMDYETQLVKALKKARDVFENNSKQFLLTSNGLLLSKSGKLVQFPYTVDTQAYREEISEFINKYQGSLVTMMVKFIDSAVVQPLFSAVIDDIAKLLDNMTDTGSMVLSKNTIEFLSKKPWEEFTVFMNQISAVLTNKINFPYITLAAFSHGVIDYQSYTNCHEANLATIKNGFYEHKNGLQPGRPLQFARLPQSLLNQWLQQIDRMGNDFARIKDYAIHTIVAQIYTKKYEPEDVLNAFWQIYRQFERVYADQRNTDNTRELLESSQLDILVDAFLNSVHQLLGENNGYGYEVKAAIAFMKIRLVGKELHLSDVAEHVGISPGYLTKLLKEATGEAFRDMLIRMKMEYAAKELKNTSIKIYELADKLGYENYRSFVKTFYKYYATNPKEYSRK